LSFLVPHEGNRPAFRDGHVLFVGNGIEHSSLPLIEFDGSAESGIETVTSCGGRVPRWRWSHLPARSFSINMLNEVLRAAEANPASKAST
jgi:hypothetical protein